MAETWKGVPVRYQLLTIGTRRPGKKLRKGKPEFLVAHDTGNPNSTAQNNVDYYENTHNIQQGIASAHIFVDDKEAIICIPVTEVAYHVLPSTTIDNAWYGVDANDGAAGVEICYFTNKTRSQKSLDNGARVLAYLAEYWGIDYKTEMPGHQDIQYDKSDPGNALQASGYGRATSNLDSIVAKYYKKDEKPTEKTKWDWAGTYYPQPTNDKGIKVWKSPSTSGTLVDKNSWLYSKDDWVNFDQIIKSDGYWWIRFKYVQPGSSKDYFYCAVCRITDPQEKIKNEKYWGTITWK
ncbi:N-acetylmuramoyl-L-alanine amidase [Staphylococcus xylosus]|uniref:N-acetylmuramoyl-L-alanine amidase n=1 Tax=Staphylococcus xylosus TaxID=1288 RepID=A0A5R9B6C7_STAXY|nr:N-acetylmuramoyl-L-alanine amidase [Staphylococcus xylosus]